MFAEEMIKQGYVSRRKHPTENLYIYNYTPKVQWDKCWNDITLQCRGLIADENDNIISRPFPKFFNIEEEGELPEEPFEVYEKLDGSLAITYQIKGNTFISTRGSFESEQAIDANKILTEKYSHVKFDPDKTYLMEYLSPTNRIVVDYGGIRDLVLIAIIDTQSGKDLPLEDIGVPVVTKYDFSDYRNIQKLSWENKEGFVVKFKSGKRVKIKFENYKRLHRILTGVSSKTIWEYLKEGSSFDELIKKVPDEFYKWLISTKGELETKYKSIEDYCISVSNEVRGKTRKELAEIVKTCYYPSVIFSMVDNKEYADQIWKLIKPSFEKAFKVEI